MNLTAALGLARLLVNQGISLDAAVGNPAIPEEFRDDIKRVLEGEQSFVLRPARVIDGRAEGQNDWLLPVDRSDWYYWPTLRQFLLSVKGWDGPAVRSLDEITDRILGCVAAPSEPEFDIRGLVLGYVQSGKTASYTSLIAKAVDVGYRIIIVLTGMDNGLRRQTQLRLNAELVGYPQNHKTAVPLPPSGKQWHCFTREDLAGDFSAPPTHAALQGLEPVLIVAKKNGPVLQRLANWIALAPGEVTRSIPLLMIDDEADQASIDTRGSYQQEGDDQATDYEPPSRINERIRDLLQRFHRRTYIAYTATPYANLLIPHDAYDPTVKNDLYPKNFIIALPKPDGYFGAEELFGRMDHFSGSKVEGLDVIKILNDDDLPSLQNGICPSTLESAILDFILAGAARAHRGSGDQPATMLVHVTHKNDQQAMIRTIVENRFGELRDEWRYQRSLGILDNLRARWETEFISVTQGLRPALVVDFLEIQPFISLFLESVEVRTINSTTDEFLDYEREPSLKAIAIGGNKLSRGLTLEGLLCSYYARESANYDTLMQMGRWFGFRRGYEDLTRIYTTQVLMDNFSDLAFVEHHLREDLSIYIDKGLTPREVGMRIWQHPRMEVTSRSKRRFAAQEIFSASYSCSLEQTFKFPLTNLEELASEAEANKLLIKDFVKILPEPEWTSTGPLWKKTSVDLVLQFLDKFRISKASNIRPDLIISYIEDRSRNGELANWVVAVRGIEKENPKLGKANWGVGGGEIFQIERTRLASTTESLGVITNPGDEAIGLSSEEKSALLNEENDVAESYNVRARKKRDPKEGLLLLYPISRFSGAGNPKKGRCSLYADPNGPLAKDLIGLALSFPESDIHVRPEAYVTGMVSWTNGDE